MLLRQAIIAGIERGEVTLAFRRWRRPSVRAGGTLRTALGVVAIDSVERIELAELAARDARRAGHASLAELRAFLEARSEGELYRIRLRWLGPDPRIALRERGLDDAAERERLQLALQRLDSRSTRGAWTQRVLRLIAQRPAVRAPDLAVQLGWETLVFKQYVRKLKNLGLTESLAVGYRLSMRGRDALQAFERA